MLVGVVTFWAGYPATGLVPTSVKVAQAVQHSDN
jgi:hypothetical protein